MSLPRTPTRPLPPLRWEYLRGKRLHDPHVVYDTGFAAVVVSRNGDRYRLSLACRHSINGTLTATSPSRRKSAIEALLPVYVACADAIDEARAAGCSLADAPTSYALVVRNEGRRVVDVLERFYTVWSTRVVLRRATRRCTAVVERRRGGLDEGTDTAYSKLVEQLSSSATEQARKALLSRIIRDEPELSVEETMAEVDRRLPASTA